VQVLAARVLLRPRDLDASVAFYEGRLGLARYREWGHAPHRGVVYFLGGGYLELTETPPQSPRPPAPQGFRLWLQVADLAATHRELTDAGVTVDAAPARMPWGLLEMTLHDPDGVELVVIETPIDHPLRRRD
jgi:catechol 2,3-dioxygenase-like lactoylglutathione lyase family enzyme